MAYDNAVSALGKICQFHRGNIDAAQVLFFRFFFLLCHWFDFDLLPGRSVADISIFYIHFASSFYMWIPNDFSIIVQWS